MTANGCEVNSRRRRIRSRNATGGYPPKEIIPSPPALLTAAASSRPAISGPIGAKRMGASIWRSSHSFVRSTIASLSQNNQRATYGQQREDVGCAPAEPSCCPYPFRVDCRQCGSNAANGACLDYFRVARHPSQIDRELWLLLFEWVQRSLPRIPALKSSYRLNDRIRIRSSPTHPSLARGKVRREV